MAGEYTLPLADPGRDAGERRRQGGFAGEAAPTRVCPCRMASTSPREAYRRFVAENGMQSSILEAVATVNPSQPWTLDKASQDIAGLFAGATVSPDISRAVATAYGDLPGKDQAVAVRSSATAEDLPGMSFAGQQETFLNVQGEEALLEAVKRCWASLWTARAVSYRARQGIAPDSVSLAVVVQKMVPAEAAGVLFTANPANGRRDQVVIDAAWGLGESVVGGEVTPDHLLLDKKSLRVLSRETADKAVMTVPTADGTTERPVAEERRRQQVLGDDTAAELASWARGSRLSSAPPRTSNGRWSMARSQFCKRARSRRCLNRSARCRPTGAFPIRQVSTIAPASWNSCPTRCRPSSPPWLPSR